MFMTFNGRGMTFVKIRRLVITATLHEGDVRFCAHLDRKSLYIYQSREEKYFNKSFWPNLEPQTGCSD
jgi:hypothetical protein